MVKDSMMLGAAIALLVTGGWSLVRAADTSQIDAGKVIVDRDCASCHNKMMSMWHGKSAADIDGRIQQVIAEKVPHPKKLELSDTQRTDIAAYWASVSK
jgi:mono/diheme cytochrome c family protein